MVNSVRSKFRCRFTYPLQYVHNIRTAVLNPEFNREDPTFCIELGVNLVKGFREEGELVKLEPSYRGARRV